MVRRRFEKAFPRTHRLRRALTESKGAGPRSYIFLDSIVEYLPNMIFVKEARELRFVLFNRAGEELLGYPREALLGKNDYDFFPRRQADWFTQKDREVLEGGQLVDIPEETLQTKERGARILHTKKIPLVDRTGKPQYLLGISEDITERKQSDAALAAHMARFQTLVRINQLICSSLDMEKVLTEIASSAAKLSNAALVSVWVADEAARTLSVRGFSDETRGRALFAKPTIGWGEGAVGSVAIHRRPLHIRDLRTEKEFVEHARWQEHDLRSLVALPIVDGEKLLAVLALASPEPVIFERAELDLMDSFVAQTAVAIRNAALYAAASAARDTALQANRAKSQFLAVMSHELRTPLNAIIGYSELIREEIDAGKLAMVNRDAAKIGTAGRHLLALINDVLDLSKIEAGKMEVILETCDVRAIVSEAMNVVQEAARRNGNTLHVEISSEVSTMFTDASKLRQSLVNVLGNACKFTHEGTVQLSVLPAEISGAPAVHFRIQDTGIGISHEHLSRLFQVFSQVDASMSRRYGGTGLGLSLSLRYCELLGGTISVESTVGKGAIFTICLPMRSQAGGIRRRVPSWPSLKAQ